MTPPTTFDSISLGVAISVPTYRRGVLGCLREFGYDPVEIPVQHLLNERSFPEILVIDVNPDHLSVIEEAIRPVHATRIVAICFDLRIDSVIGALEAGAHSVVPWDLAPEGIVSAMAATGFGLVCVPELVESDLLEAWSAHRTECELTTEEAHWLSSLATGITVEALSEDEAMSKKTLDRRLGALYQRMGATNKTEALLLAMRWGILAKWQPQRIRDQCS